MENEAHWYAIKVFYNRVFEMETLLNPYGIETFVACEKVKLEGRDRGSAVKRLADENDHIAHRMYEQTGPDVFRNKPMVNSILFARADEQQVSIIEEKLSDKETGIKKGFIYKDSTWKHYCVIPDLQMSFFKDAILKYGDKVRILTDVKPTRFNTGDRVRVKEGPFKGAEGYIIRINKDRRFVVCIEGVLAVATSYIPKHMLEKVEE